jgi:hypothetical protein
MQEKPPAKDGEHIIENDRKEFEKWELALAC